MIESQIVTLEEALSLVIDHRGKTVKKMGADFSIAGHRVISAINIKDRRVDNENLRYVAPDVYQRWMREPLRAGDVLLTSEAPLGEIAYVREDSDACLGQRLFALRGNPDLLHGRYLFYALSFGETREDLLSRATGTTVTGIRQSELLKVRIELPSLREQKAIADVLGALDDKIESNRRRWQISTELVRAEYESLLANGTGSLCQMNEICDFNLRTLKSGPPDEIVRYIDISSVESGVVTGENMTTWANAPSRARRFVVDGDLIFSTVRPARMAFSILFDPDLSTVVSTGFAVMSPKGVPSTLIFAIISNEEFGKYCESVAQGSAYPAVSPDSMGHYEVFLPEKDSLSDFESRTEPILRRAYQGLAESRLLSGLRNVLLPELLSGRLRVKDAESMVENV